MILFSLKVLNILCEKILFYQCQKIANFISKMLDDESHFDLTTDCKVSATLSFET